MKKVFFVLGSLLVFILIAAILCWYEINHYVIPQLIVPAMKKKIADFNRRHKSNLEIREIYFHPLTGFKLKGFRFNQVISAEEVDIDLNYFALLSKNIQILDMNVSEGALNIVRNKGAGWSYEPMINAIIQFQKEQTLPMTLTIDQVSICRSRLFFSDQFSRRNKLARHFQDIDMKFKMIGRDSYFVEGGGKEAKQRDAFFVVLKYFTDNKRLKGMVKIKTADLSPYWEYYLDDVMPSLRLTKGQVEAKVEFSRDPEETSIDGNYLVCGGCFGYGDIKVGMDGSINHHQKLFKLQPKNNSLKMRVEFSSGFAKLSGRELISDARGIVSFVDRQVQLDGLAGNSYGREVMFSGGCGGEGGEWADLTGNIGGFNVDLHLKKYSSNSAWADIMVSKEASYLKADVLIKDLKSRFFYGRLAGEIDLFALSNDIAAEAKKYRPVDLAEIPKKDFRGKAGLSGELQGCFDDPKSFSGQLGLKVDEFSWQGIEPLSFLLGIKADKGVFSSAIPRMHLYDGSLDGALIFDESHWGIEINVDKMELAKFTKIDPRLEGLEGLFNGKMAVVGRWGDNTTLRGGGKFLLTDADLKSAPIFSTAQRGVGSVIKDFKMPDFKEVKGNFEITGEVVRFNGTMAKSRDMELRGSGTIDLSGRVNFVMGVKFLPKQNLKTALYIIFPLQTLGFDLLSETIKVEIGGTIADIKQTTTVQPLAWLNNSFIQSSDSPSYSLEQLWP